VGSGSLDNVNRWYQPATGRYLSPDPLRIAVMEGPSSTSTLLNERFGLFSYVDGNPILFIDPLGLYKFKGCNSGQKQAISASLAQSCARIESPQFLDCCGRPTLVKGLRRLCADNELVIRCEPRSTGKCSQSSNSSGRTVVTCAWSVPFGKVIRLCPDSFTTSCGPLGCTVLHEMTHMLGHPMEGLPNKVEGCLDCGD
jgi:RHS repeat-associated protein